HTAFITPILPLFLSFLLSFFFNPPSTTDIYTLSLHDALPIYRSGHPCGGAHGGYARAFDFWRSQRRDGGTFDRLCDARQKSKARSEEHTSELQSLAYLVCRLLLEKKKKNKIIQNTNKMILFFT